jgi:hypothetical protein
VIVQAWIDFFFPPLCVGCGERSATKFFCPSCWELCAAPDPVGRCPHCFEESDGLCKRCGTDADLPFSRASVFEATGPALHLARARPDLLAAFAARRWVELDWPFPDVVIPMRGAAKLALEFSSMIDRPYANLFKRKGCDAEAIETDMTLLLIDTGASLANAKEAIHSLAEAFPKKGFLLSLFPYALPDL